MVVFALRSESGKGEHSLPPSLTSLSQPTPVHFHTARVIKFSFFLSFYFWCLSVWPQGLSAHMGFLLVRLFGPCACSRMGWASCLCCCCSACRPGGRALGRRVRLAVLLCPSSGIAGLWYRIALWAEYWLKCDLVFNLQHKRKLDPVGSDWFRRKVSRQG